jgi:hypothetical protein
MPKMPTPDGGVGLLFFSFVIEGLLGRVRDHVEANVKQVIE